MQMQMSDAGSGRSGSGLKWAIAAGAAVGLLGAAIIGYAVLRDNGGKSKRRRKSPSKSRRKKSKGAAKASSGDLSLDKLCEILGTITGDVENVLMQLSNLEQKILRDVKASGQQVDAAKMQSFFLNVSD